MNNKKNSFSAGIVLSAVILGSVFFVSATAPVFSQQNTTDLPSTNNKTHDANNSTSYSNATEGGTGNWSHPGLTNSTVN